MIKVFCLFLFSFFSWWQIPLHASPDFRCELLYEIYGRYTRRYFSTSLGSRFRSYPFPDRRHSAFNGTAFPKNSELLIYPKARRYALSSSRTECIISYRVYVYTGSVTATPLITVSYQSFPGDRVGEEGRLNRPTSKYTYTYTYT